MRRIEEKLIEIRGERFRVRIVPWSDDSDITIIRLGEIVYKRAWSRTWAPVKFTRITKDLDGFLDSIGYWIARLEQRL